MSNYQIEDLENEACKKSNMAKRVVAGAGLAAAGAGAAFAATQLTNDEIPTPELTPEDLLNTVTDGVSENDMPEKTEEAPAEPAKNEEVHVYHHVVEEKPAEVGVEYSDTTTFVDEYGNRVASVDQGTVDGEKFALYDNDGDGVADYFAYDANGDKVFQNDEIINVEGEGILMRDPGKGLVVVVEDDSAPIWNIEPTYDDDGFADINNDFTNEKTGEAYYGDLADNNRDYRNNENPDQYSLGTDSEGGYNAGSQYDVADNYYSDEKITGDAAAADDLAYDEEAVADDMLDASADLAYDEPAEDMSQYDLV